MLKTLHAAAVALVALAAVPASAQTLVTWDGGGVGGNWLTGSNWIGDTAPVATNGLVFSGAIQTTNTNNFTANTIFDSLTLASTGFTLRGNALQLSSSGTDIFANVQGANSFIFTPISASTGGLVVSATGANLLQLSGIVSGAGGLTKDGNAILQMSAASTYTGDTTLANGSIRTGIANALPTTTVLRFSANSNARRLTLQGNSQTLNGVDSTAATGGTLILESAIDNTNNAPATLTLNVASGTSYAFSGFVRNAAGGTNSALSITKSGGGTQVFSSGTASVSYSGTTTINAGVLEFSGANSVANNSPITLAGGTVRFSGGGTRSTEISGTGGLEKSGANQLTLSTNNPSFSGTTTLSSGTLLLSASNALGTSTVTVNGGLLDLSSGTVTLRNLNGGGGTISLGNGGRLTANMTALGQFGGVISGTGGLEKSGANQLTLSTDNPSFSGTTTLSSGTLLLSASNALGTSTVTVNGGLLDLSSGTVTLRNLNGGGGTISLGNGGRLTANMTALGQFGGVISGTGGLTKDGGLALTLSAASTYSGDTILANGDLRLGVADALPAATVLRFSATSNNRRLSQQGFSQTLAGVDSTAATGGILILESAADGTSNAPATLTLNVASGTSYAFSGYVRNSTGTSSPLSVTKNSGGTQVFSAGPALVSYSGTTTINAGVLEFSGANSVANNSPITLAGGTVRFSGGGTRSTAIGGSGGLEKSGANLLTLSGSHSFSGLTTISAGTLAVNGALASGVNVANAAILGGSGTINGFVAVADGGILAPGNSPGTLSTTAGLSLVDSSILNFELNASDPTVGGGINDLVEVTGDFTLAGILNVAGTGDFATVADYTTWRLFNYSGGTFTSGTLTLGTMPSVGSSGRYFQLDTATAGQVNLVIVPEPGALALTGLGIVAAAWALRRK
jgi:fibronectin-binding autotransporter adhesin